jgi:hypothetical protein
MTYMTDPQADESNKLMASTEIKKIIQSDCFEDPERLDSIMLNLLHIYVGCSDTIAKHFKSVIS